jgi:pimeloyl-ACP methyl ester carboxylesterase
VPNISIAETDLYYERRGEGEPLLLIQGLGGNSLHWGEPFLADLESDLAVFARARAQPDAGLHVPGRP